MYLHCSSALQIALVGRPDNKRIEGAILADSAPSTKKNGWQPYIATGKNGKYPLPASSVWAAGLVALFLLLIVTLVVIVPRVETRLTQQTSARLDAAGIDATTLAVSANYRNLSIYGELPPGVDMEHLAVVLNSPDHASSTWFAEGARQVRVEVSEAPVPIVSEPLIPQRLDVQFLSDGKIASLDGMVQTQAQRERLVNAALESGVESINDNLDVLVGNQTTDGGDVKVDTLVQMLALSGPEHVAAAQAKLTTRNLTYRYTAKDRAAARLIEQASALTMVDFEVIGEMGYIRRGSIDATAISDGSEIVLSGSVLSDVHQKRLNFAAAEAVGADNVIDNLTVSGEEARLGGAGKRVEIMASALSLFKPGSSVTMQLAGSDLNVDAVVQDDTDRGALMDALHQPDSAGGDIALTVNEKIKVLNVDENNRVDLLQEQLDAYTQLIRKTVVFNSGETQLGRRAKSTLDKVALKIADFPGLRVEVEGHTDNVGRARVNDELSQKRANAVRDYLIARSVPAESLVAVGYGQRRPLESNDTVEGRRLNRRVHFSVLENKKND